LGFSFARLPGTSLQLTQVGDKVLFQEHPRLAWLGAGHIASLGATLERVWVQMQKFGGLVEVKGFQNKLPCPFPRLLA